MTEPSPARRTNPLVVVIVLVAAMAVYFVLIGYRGIYLLGQGRWTLKLLGVAVLVLPLIGIWVVVAELRFGLASQRLAERLRGEGISPEPPELPRLASGRPDRAAADAWFERQRVLVEAAPDDWRGWFALAQAYDLAGDRRRGREALRTAIGKAD
ncbi:MAG: hypothetical protein M3Y42_17160 [Actinomycetota bacterium]|nr:hypothetical protein [Actinomycetota bacterium]MDQ2958676.1 hypothetical protein [Actinomycetota bacterium]